MDYSSPRMCLVQFEVRALGHGLHLWRIASMRPRNDVKRCLSLAFSPLCQTKGNARASPLHRAVEIKNIEIVNALLSEIRTMKDYEIYAILSAQLPVSGRPVAWRLILFYLLECVLGNHSLSK